MEINTLQKQIHDEAFNHCYENYIIDYTVKKSQYLYPMPNNDSTPSDPGDFLSLEQFKKMVNEERDSKWRMTMETLYSYIYKKNLPS